MEYDFPNDIGPVPARKRELFYREDFLTDVLEDRMKRWPELAVIIDIGSDTTYYKPRFKDLKGKLVRITDYDGVSELREKLIEYSPEDVYYGRTMEKANEVQVNPDRELVFGLGPHHVTCTRCERKRDYMDEKQHQYVFCMDCFDAVAHETWRLYRFLERHFDDMDVVFTGRKFHIHVNDPEAFHMQMEDRKELASKVATQFPIDEDITSGEQDLVRLPGSLNGVTGLVATKLDVADLHDPEDIIEQATPNSF